MQRASFRRASVVHGSSVRVVRVLVLCETSRVHG